MARGFHLFVEEGETTEEALRREQIAAPHGRCGDVDSYYMQGYPGCGEPLPSDDMLACYDFPDCCRP